MNRPGMWRSGLVVAVVAVAVWGAVAVRGTGDGFPSFAPGAGAEDKAPARDGGLSGFTAERAAQQQKLEAAYRALPSPERMREIHRYLTAEPHPAGSECNNELARHIAEEWKKQGWEDVTMHRYDVLSSFPREVTVEMVEPVRFKASMREDPYDIDPDTKNPAVSSGYLAFSASGEVTAPVVYAFSGNPEEYAVLKKHGIDVRGKIVLVRYSDPYSYRGFKALTAERMGAAGILIYSDPMEDGYVRGPVYPDGPWGPESHIQRGAITYDFIVPGDPLTPGWASLPDAKRIPIEEAQSVPKIMGAPLSWRDAKPLLENMDGPVAPKAWQGGLPIEYRLGGERVKVHLKVDMDTSVMPNYVVEARIRGAEFPDEWVILGNHRDAWEFGGVDPSSGTASMMELTRAMGELLKKGHRPRRTIVVASWDGEEVALTGSTEWGEHFAEKLKRKAVAYLNVDSSASGPNFQGQAVASLAPLLVDVARGLDDPKRGGTLLEAWREVRAEYLKKKRPGDGELADTRIGSGSDHTVFLNHLGIPTYVLSFRGPYGVYHSMYDNFFWMNNFGDPGYRYHTLMTELWGVLALRLANADVLPFDFEVYGQHLQQFIGDLERDRQARRRVDLRGLQQRARGFEAAGRRLNRAVEAALAGGADAGALAGVNRGILQVERNWLNPEGIPGRPWFKHMLYAARYTYANLELPGLTEAVEAQQWEVAREQARLLAGALERNTRLVNELAAKLEAGQKVD